MSDVGSTSEGSRRRNFTVTLVDEGTSIFQKDHESKVLADDDGGRRGPTIRWGTRPNFISSPGCHVEV